MRRRGRPRVVALLGSLILCTACSGPSAPATDNARKEMSGINPRSSRSGTGSKPAAKTGRTETSRTASRVAEHSEASAPTEVIVETPAVTPPVASLTNAAQAVARLSAGGGCSSGARAFIVLRDTDAFVEADANSHRLATIAAGVRVIGVASQGDWRLVLFNDGIWGQRAAYVRCSELALAAAAAPTLNGSPSPLDVAAVRRQPPVNPTVDPRQQRETVRGYLDWHRGDYVIVDGQRIRWGASTRMQLGRLPFISSVPAGYEMVVAGRRARDGSLIAERIEAVPNRVVLHDTEVVQQFDELERAWLADGTMSLTNGTQRRIIGQIEEAGAAVDRVREIMNRIIPPYVDGRRIRVRVVESNEWNALAMANGAIWVNTGLLNDTSDDELAVVLGHELAHYTYEHSLRSKLSLLGWGSAYSRDLEDQADRVGLRYAYEAGFDVERAIDVWSRERPRATDRIKSIRRELQVNYRSN
jgi:Peptidase family M48